MVGAADRVRRPARVAIDAVTASWTIGSEEDGYALYRSACRTRHGDLRDMRAVARRAPGGPRERLSPALTPGQRRRRRRLDLYMAQFRSAAVELLRLLVSCPGRRLTECVPASPSSTAIVTAWTATWQA